MSASPVVSVRSPFPMPEATSNVFSSGNAGQGFAAAGSNLLVLFGSGLALRRVTRTREAGTDA